MAKKASKTSEGNVTRYDVLVSVVVDGNSTTVVATKGDVSRSVTKLVSGLGGKDQEMLERMYMVRQVVGEVYTEISKISEVVK